MIKYLKKLWKKLFGKTSTTLPENIGEPTPVVESKSLHCITHNRFKKSCTACKEIII